MKIFEKGGFSVTWLPEYGDRVFFSGRRHEVCVEVDCAVAMAHAILAQLAPREGFTTKDTKSTKEEEGGAV